MSSLDHQLDRLLRAAAQAPRALAAEPPPGFATRVLAHSAPPPDFAGSARHSFS